MTKSRPFNDQLKDVEGTVRRINMSDYFERKERGLLYYFNIAEQMNKAALALWRGDEQHPSVCAMLAGMSVELLLKGTLMGLQEKFPKHHRLVVLCDEAGIAISENDRVILEALSEHVYWAARYPTPLDAEKMLQAQEVFQKQRNSSGKLSNLYKPETAISLTNYERIWDMFVTHFFRVQSAVFESAETIAEPPYGAWPGEPDEE